MNDWIEDSCPVNCLNIIWECIYKIQDSNINICIAVYDKTTNEMGNINVFCLLLYPLVK